MVCFVYFGDLLRDFVDFVGIFFGSYGEGCREVVETQFLCESGSLFESQVVAGVTSFTALLLLFHSAYCLVKNIRNVIPFDDFDGVICIYLINKSFDFRKP